MRIIGVRTELRVSDLLSLSTKDINDGFIELRNKKTDYPVIIPLHRQRNGNSSKKKRSIS